MASIFFFFVGVILIILLNLFLSQIFKTRNSNLPPGKTGWPIIGETLGFATNPEKFIQSRMMKYSTELFKTSIAGEKMAILCGPLANKFIFSNNTKLFSRWSPKSVAKILFYPINIDHSLDDHSFLKLNSMQNYVSVMDSMAKEHMNSHWHPFKEVKVHPLAKYFTFALSCRLFTNLADPARVSELAESFFIVAKGIISVPVNIPGTQFSRAVKGGEVIREKFREVVKQRRIELSETRGDREPKDLLGRLLVNPEENGKFLNEEEIVNKIIGYLFAAFFTTSNAITFVLSHLAEHPDVYDKVLEEQREIAKSKGAGEMLTWADVQKMKYTWNVVCESMRMVSPSQGGFQDVLTDFNFGGFKVPKGWKVFWTVHSTNKDPKYFPDPEKFNPSRFEGSGPPPFTFVPFGGGPRMCAGNIFARMEILVYVHNVVTRFRLKKATLNEKITYNAEPVPSQGLPICIQTHDKF